MNKLIDQYVSWNKVFEDYFFHRQGSEEEIFLYVTKDLIDELGNKNGLGGCDKFLKMILMTKETRSTFYAELLFRFVGNYRIKTNNASILESASANLINQNLYRHLPCAFLNYIVLVVLIVSEAQSDSVTAIGNHLSRYLRDHIRGENGRREYLEMLFDELHRLYPNFKNYNLVPGQRYIGLLKYQLVLSVNQIERLKESLYKNGFTFDEDLTYNEKVSKIYDYVDDDLKTLLISSLDSEPYRKRFDDILSNFDAEVYAESHQQLKERTYLGRFVHALYFGDGDYRLVLLTDIKDITAHDNHTSIESERYDSLGGYNPKHVLYDGLDKVYIRDYKLSTSSCNITSLGNKGVVFLQKYNDDYYIETRMLSERETYILVKDQSSIKQSWNRFVSNNIDRRIEQIPLTEDIFNIFGRGWLVFISDNGFISQYYKDTLSIGTKKGVLSKPIITMSGGIIPNNKKNVYLSNALPYFIFPVNIDRQGLKLSINLDDKTLHEGVDYDVYIQDYKNLIINLKKYDFYNDISSIIDIDIDYKSERFTQRLTQSFSICGQSVDYKQEELLMYNKWGELITDKDDSAILTGFNVKCAELQPMRGVSLNIEPECVLDLDHLLPFYFINLVSATCFMTENKMITNNVLQKCIKYTATRTRVNYSADLNFISRLKNLLVNSGYLSPSYVRGCTRYQANPPTFIALPSSKGGNQDRFYMLAGCYTQKYLVGLVNYCREHEIEIYLQKKNEINASAAYSLVPPIILIQSKFDPHSFMEETKCLCGYNDDDFALSLLTKVPSIAEYEHTLREIDEDMFNIDLEPLNNSEENLFPRVRNSSAKDFTRSRWIELERGHYAASSVKDYAWMELFCRYKQNKPIFVSSRNGKLYIPDNIHLPYIVQRVLFIMNVGQPEYLKTFILNNQISDLNHEPLFTKVKMYSIGVNSERLSTFIQVLTSKNIYNENSLVQLTEGNPSLYYQIDLFTRSFVNISHKEPKYYLTLTDKSKNRVIAYANSKSVYVLEDNHYYKVHGTPNEIFSLLVDFRKRIYNLEDHGIVRTDEIVSLPDFDHYQKETIELL